MEGEISELRERITRNLYDDKQPWGPMFIFLEEKTGVERNKIFWSSFVIILLWIAFGFAGQILCNLVGVLYPSYASIHAIESQAKDDDTKWLTYWVVFSIFTFLESFASIVTGWIPLYWLLKCMFCVWLMIPTGLNGSLILYRNFIKPNFLQYHSAVDGIVSQAQATASELLEKNK